MRRFKSVKIFLLNPLTQLGNGATIFPIKKKGSAAALGAHFDDALGSCRGSSAHGISRQTVFLSPFALDSLYHLREGSIQQQAVDLYTAFPFYLAFTNILPEHSCTAVLFWVKSILENALDQEK